MRDLVFPYDHRMVESTRVRDNARDEGSDVVQVSHQVGHVACSVNRMRRPLSHLRRLAALGEREGELHEPADLDKRIRQADVLDEVVDSVFLQASE